ncbi:MAG: 3-deoxy-manno-octulosonate cytidylyltransferase [Bacteroidota bacterium]
MNNNPMIVAIIPARMGSSRFPGKPLADINGISMVAHCLNRTEMCKQVSLSYVATCDEEIATHIQKLGGKVVMTSDSHDRASDRTAEAMLKIEKEIGRKVDIVLMVQGDEPMITPSMISESLDPFFCSEEVLVVNLMAPIIDSKEFEDPNEVKVVVDQFDNAIYFSREPIPSKKKYFGDVPMFKQVCVIPFERDFLLKFNHLQETTLEKIESVDMMRVIEHGYKVKMVRTNETTFSVDTKDDLNKVILKMKDDPLIRQYTMLSQK